MMQGLCVCVCVCVCVCMYTLGIISSTVRSKRAVSVGSGAGFTVADEQLGAGLKLGVPCRNAPPWQGSSGELNITWVCAGNLGHPTPQLVAELSPREQLICLMELSVCHLRGIW